MEWRWDLLFNPLTTSSGTPTSGQSPEPDFKALSKGWKQISPQEVCPENGCQSRKALLDPASRNSLAKGVEQAPSAGTGVVGSHWGQTVPQLWRFVTLELYRI